MTRFSSETRRGPSALLVAALAGVVHEDSSHQLGRDGEEVRPVPRAYLLRVDQPQISLVNEGRGLQFALAALTAHVALRPPVQLGMDQGINRSRAAWSPWPPRVGAV
jgi:hypothetical protein